MIRRLTFAAALLLLSTVIAPRVGATPMRAVVANVSTPSSLTVFDRGNGPHLYVASYSLGQVLAYPILPGGLLGKAGVYAKGFSHPLGIAFGPDSTMFVSDSHTSARAGRKKAGRVWALRPGGGSTTSNGKVVVDELPNGNHNTNGLAVHGQRLYITNGSSTDDGVNGISPDEPLSGTIVSVPLTARGRVVGSPQAPLPSGLVVEAFGMRNPYDLVFGPGTDRLWVPDNGPDKQAPWGEDMLHKFNVSRSARDHGFPGCVYRAGPDGPMHPSSKQNGNTAVKDVCTGYEQRPAMTLGMHVSADGAAFGPSKGWGGDLYIAEFGNGAGTAGHRIVRVPFDGESATGSAQVFLSGGTPVDLTFGAAGMYVADFGAGTVALVKA